MTILTDSLVLRASPRRMTSNIAAASLAANSKKKTPRFKHKLDLTASPDSEMLRPLDLSKAEEPAATTKEGNVI